MTVAVSLATESRPACQAVSAFWDSAVERFLAGGSAVPAELARWSAAYRGQGQGAVALDAFPEPYVGPLTGRPAGVFLALNPGHAHLDFQGRGGIFADEIRALGSYSAWAASWPYLRDPWVTAKGRNRHHSGRLTFLRRWTATPRLPASAMVGFELYPWHSTAVTGSMRPDPGVLREFVWRPIAELAAPVFAFGAPWFPLLEHGFRLELVDRLGSGGRPYPTAVPSRAVAVFRSAEGVTVVAERHSGSAGPPSAGELSVLQAEIDHLL
jgi:hypothetical protein